MTGTTADTAVAVIGMAGRFPGAADVPSFWTNLCSEVDSISRFSAAELAGTGRGPAHSERPGFVGAEGVLDGVEEFDAELFGFAPREAQIMDPQHRIGLEVAWDAFETSGHDPLTTPGAVGVFLSCSMSTYLVRNLLPNTPVLDLVGGFTVLTHNDKDFLATVVSHRLGFTGPSMAVGSACSSSLVAVHLAVQSLLSGESDLALAGGVSVQVPQRTGHVHTTDGIYSLDGRCAPFDDGATGTVGGSGAAMVLLKPYGDALRDGDHVHALILGSAVNNDGRDKVGFTAPGFAGQRDVIREAHAVAGVEPADIGYVEAHGTGTRLGDPLEVAALTAAFGASEPAAGSCAIGSVKSNIGHLDAAAGAAGLVKGVLAVEHGVVPASLHFRSPNREIDFGPFFVPSRTSAWTHRAGPRLAGVSSFGIGGTNAHVVLAQEPSAAKPTRPPSADAELCLVLSARSAAELDRSCAALADALEAGGPDVELGGVARSLAGKPVFTHRRVVRAADAGCAVRRLRAPATGVAADAPNVVIDVGAPGPSGAATGRDEFAERYAVAMSLLDLGVEPAALTGRGPGLFLAGAVAGLWSLQDARELGGATDPDGLARVLDGLAPGAPTSPVRHPDTGRVLTGDETADPSWWLGAEPGGPGSTSTAGTRVVELATADVDGLLTELWCAGRTVRWDRHPRWAAERRAVVPGHPFRRVRHWVDAPGTPALRAAPTSGFGAVQQDISSRLAGVGRTDPPRVIDSEPGLRSGLDALCASLAWEYLHTGAPTDDLPWSVDGLCRSLGVRRPYRPFVAVMVELLCEDGFLERSVGGFEPAGAPPEAASQLSARLVDHHPDFAGMIRLLAHCAAGYRRGLAEAGAGLGVLYPSGDVDLVRRAMVEETVPSSWIEPLGGAVAGLARTLADRPEPLRVLEVGAGGGRLTASLASALAGTSARLDVTDVAPSFLQRLAGHATARGYDFARTALLDITEDPGAQGFAPGSYDLIVGTDVAHVVPDVGAALGNLHTLLAPGGLLAMVETTRGERWTSMVWGLTEQWWSARDGREGGPLLDPDGWRAVLSGCDFAEAAVLEVPSPHLGDGSILLAEKARTAPGPAWPARLADPDRWTYRPGWRQASDARPAASLDGTTVVVLVDGPAGHRVVEALRGGGADVVAIPLAEGPAAAGPALRPDDEAGHDRLFADLHAAGRVPRVVVQMWDAEQAEPATASTVGGAQLRGLHHLLLLSRVLGRRDDAARTRVVAVTRGAQDVLGDDLTHPERSTVGAAIKIIPLECPTLSCTHLDLPSSGTDVDRYAAAVVAEAFTETAEPTVALRGDRRWLPELRPHAVPEPGAGEPPGRGAGPYLVCGGLGGVGVAITEHLVRGGATVVATRRTPFPARSDWARLAAAPVDADDDRALVRRLLAAEDHGGRVVVHAADVADRAAMSAVFDEVRDRFGAIRGVVHAAGVADRAGVIQRRTRADTDTAVSAKVVGAMVLHELTAGTPLEFFVLCSSLGTVLPKLKYGEVGYVAGNEFLDALASARRAAGLPAITVSWTDWTEAGMWARARHELADRYRDAGGPDSLDGVLQGLSTAEGIAMFRRLVADGAGPRILVCTQDLVELRARHDGFTTADRARAVDRLSLPGATSGGDALPSDDEDVATRVTRWCAELLGYPLVGPAEDFFELGGDSLIALRLLSFVERDYGVEVPIGVFFDDSTVTALVAAVERAVAAAGAAPPDVEQVFL